MTSGVSGNGTVGEILSTFKWLLPFGIVPVVVSVGGVFGLLVDTAVAMAVFVVPLGIDGATSCGGSTGEGIGGDGLSKVSGLGVGNSSCTVGWCGTCDWSATVAGDNAGIVLPFCIGVVCVASVVLGEGILIGKFDGGPGGCGCRTAG